MNGKTTDLKTWLLFAFLFVALFALESIAVHSVFALDNPGIADFYSRWAGARAWLLEGRDPYSLEVTKEIQPVLGIDPTQIGKGGFNYPLHVIYLFWPLVYLPYDWTQAIWIVTLQWVAIGTMVALLRLNEWELSPLGLVGLLLATLLFYLVTRTIMLGQFTLHVTLFLVLALLALRRGYDGWAGILLAATSIKPQLVIFIGFWLVLWAIRQRRWRFIAGILGGGAFFLFSSMALLPRWPLSFLEDVQRYSKVAGGRNPLEVLLALLWPGSPEAIAYLLSGLLLLAMLWSWYRNWLGNDESSEAAPFGKSFERALHWTIVVGILVSFQTGTTNQVLLLIPLFAWLRQAFLHFNQWLVISVATVVLLIAPWALFLTTISGNAENTIMFLPFPLLCLAVLIGLEAKEKAALTSAV